MAQSSRNHALGIAARSGAALLLLMAGMSAAGAEYKPPRVDNSCPTPPPDVPDSATVNGEHGEVVLNVFVTSHGRPKKIRVIHSSGFDDLDNAAVTAAATWHYTPAVVDTGNVSDWFALKMEFGAHETGVTLKAPSADAAGRCS